MTEKLASYGTKRPPPPGMVDAADFGVSLKPLALAAPPAGVAAWSSAAGCARLSQALSLAAAVGDEGRDAHVFARRPGFHRGGAVQLRRRHRHLGVRRALAVRVARAEAQAEESAHDGERAGVLVRMNKERATR